MLIVGAGLSGLIAGHYFRRLRPIIYEKQDFLPNNHAAVLRFRTRKVSNVTEIPFIEGVVRKAVIANEQFAYGPNPWLSNQYSFKVTGKVTDRSIWDLTSGTRYIAPPGFTGLAAAGLRIDYGRAFNAEPDIPVVISTMPMPQLMEIVGWTARPAFQFRPIWSVQVEIISPEVDVFQTIYYPDPADQHYRASITRSTLIVEFASCPSPGSTSDAIRVVLDDFGLVDAKYFTGLLKEHKYGKILPCDEEARKQFIYTMTREHNIYSLGRFATWKQILLDDVVDDCAVIADLIAAEGGRRTYHQSIVTSRKEPS